ncbi:MAG TPA: hypothetical protein VGW75_13460 [Solirubrobacteraceae bacterium]|jgi:hypothetical protein|nr:hypothetical protein [Solirubrobacteraceae bacterium]
MWKIAPAAVVVALAAAAPAYGINDGRVPADECSGNPNAVGTPGGAPNPGLAQAEPVGPPASANNPGASTGARGEERSQAPCNEH